MRHCVLRHHVCLCVLSTAMLAGFALLTEQKKGYAQLLQDYCKPVANSDEKKWRIECDGSSGTRTLGVNRDINMGKMMGRWGTVDNSGHPAVKVYNRANIRITSSVLKITGSGKNIYPAIKVYSEGVLTVMNVTATGVKKGIEADGKGSIVTVNQGKIEVRADGVSVIEVKGGGKVTLNDEVTVTGGGDSTGIVVGGTGGNVTLMTKNFTGVNKGIVFKEMGSGQAANVTGVGAGTMMTVTAGGTGIMMEGAGVTANASVMSMTVKGQNSGTGVDMKNGMLTLTNLDMTGFDRGAQVSNGKLTVMGGEIKVEANGVGLSVEGMGSASVMGGKITTTGGGVTGVDMKGTGKVELSGVTVSNFATGISVTKGTVTVSGESTIRGTTVGVEVKGNGNFVAVMSGEGKIEVTTGTGLKVMGEGTVSVTGGKITTSGSGQGTGVLMEGEETVTLSGVTVSNFATGISVTGEGTVTMNGDSTIQGVETGVSVQSGKFVASMSKEGKIEVTAGTGVGLKVMGTGSASVTGGKITTSGGGGTGVEAGGKTVELTGVEVSGFKTGISVTSGEVRVNGESGIVVTADGVGLKVMGMGSASVMNSAIMASGSGIGQGTGVLMESSGTVTLNGVGISGFTTGISVTKGEVRVNGSSRIQGKSMGVSVEGGTFMMGGSSGIQVEADGTGLKVEKTGTATVMNTTIMGAVGGSGVTGKVGVEVSTLGGEGVKLDGVTVTGFKTGVNMTKGKFKMTRGSITGNGVTGNIGVYATGGDVTLDEGVEISGFTTGVDVESGTLTISGGKITGTGSGGSYGVYVGSGVTRADLMGTVITGKGSGKGVYARGEMVMISGGEIKEVEEGVYARGKVVMISGGTTIEFAGDYGVYVGGAVKNASLKDVTIKGGGKGYGVYAASGTVTLEGVVKISQVEMGVYMKSGELTISGNSRISFTGDYGVGVIVGDGVTKATLNDLTIRGNGSGKGVYARGKVVTISGGTRIEGVKEGIVMMGKGTLTVKKGTEINLASDSKYGVYVGIEVTKATLTETVITGQNKGYGVYAEGKNVTLEGVGISNVKTGVEVMRGTLVMNGVHGKNSTIGFMGDGVGVKVGDGVASANLKDVTIMGNGVGGTGIHAMGKMMMISGGEISQVKTGVYAEKGRLTMTGGTKINLARGGDYGVYVKNTAMTNLTGTVITGQNKGTGVYAVGMTGKNGALTMELALTGVTIKRVEEGVKMRWGKSLTISGGSIDFTGGGDFGGGVYVAGGDVTLTNVGISGGGLASTGVMTMGTGVVKLTDVKISKVKTGVEVSGTGTLTLERGTTIELADGGRYGVYARGMEEVTLTEVGIKGGGLASTGVEVWGENVTLTNVGISNVGKGVSMMSGNSLTIRGLHGKNSTISFVGEYGVYVEGGVKNVRLDDVTIKGENRGYGVYARGTMGKNGALTMALTGVRISEVGAGVVMVEGKSLTISGESSVISFVGDDGVGVGVGDGVKSANLKDVTIKGNGSGKGVVAMGGEVTVDKVTIEGVETGVVMSGIGKLTLERRTRIELARGGRYGVYVEGEEVSASLMETVIKGGGKGSTGVYVEGKDVTLTLTDVDISQVGMGITMKGDGTLTVMEDSTINFMESGYGVMVGGEVTAELIGTTIKGENRGSGTGVIMESSGKMMLEDVDIKGVKTGVYAEKGELEIKGKTEIEFAKNGWGVVVGNKVTRATLDDVTITGKGGSGSMGVYVVGYGMGAVGGGGDVTLEKVRIEGVETGVSMVWGKSLTISGGAIAKVKTGVSVKNGGMLTVKEGTTISFVEDYGVYVGGGVMAKLIGTTIKGEGMGKMGVYVEETGVVELNMVTTEGVETGVAMTRSGMLVISGDSTINFVGDYGVYVKNTAMVELAKTRIIGQNSGRGGNNGVKYGVYATGGDVTMTLNDVTIEEVKTGITMLGGGLKVSGGSIKGVTTGIAMSGSGTLMVEKGTEIQFTKGYGVMVGGGVTVGERVTAKLTETTIRGEGKGSTGVYVAGGDALLEQVKIEGSNQATGLYVTQGAVRLQNTTLRDVAMGMTISQGVVMMEGGSIEFTDRYGISVSGGQAVLSGFKIIKKGNEDTDKSTGVWVDNSGKVMMRGVDISGVQMGAYVMETGLLVMDKGSIDFKGEYGIYTSLQNSP